MSIRIPELTFTQPLVLHIRFALGGGGDTKFDGPEAIFLVKGAGVDIHLEGIQPQAARRKRSGMDQQLLTESFPDTPRSSAGHVIRMNVQMVDKISFNGHKGCGATG